MDKIFSGNHLLSFFCQAVIWVQPAFYYAYEHHLRDHGAYPWDGDTVIIPIFWNAIFWLVWGPLLLRLVGRRFRRVDAPLRFFAWNAERPIFTVVVCLGTLALICLTADEIRHDLKWQNYTDLGYMGCWGVVWLVLRSLLLSTRADAEPAQLGSS
jgi:hypothetical protein